MERSMDMLMVRFNPANGTGLHHEYKLNSNVNCIGGKHETSAEVYCDEDNGMCEFANLEPAIKCNISMMVCLEVNAEDICSEPSPSLTVWTMPECTCKSLLENSQVRYYFNSSISSLAPSRVSVSSASDSSLEVTIAPPNVTNLINLYEAIALSNDTMEGSCKTTLGSSYTHCTILGLAPNTNYTVMAYSSIQDGATILRSSETATMFYLEGELVEKWVYFTNLTKPK